MNGAELSASTRVADELDERLQGLAGVIAVADGVQHVAAWRGQVGDQGVHGQVAGGVQVEHEGHGRVGHRGQPEVQRTGADGNQLGCRAIDEPGGGPCARGDAHGVGGAVDLSAPNPEARAAFNDLEVDVRRLFQDRASVLAEAHGHALRLINACSQKRTGK